MKSSYLGEREVKAVSLGGALSGGVLGWCSSRFDTSPSPTASVLVVWSSTSEGPVALQIPALAGTVGMSGHSSYEGSVCVNAAEPRDERLHTGPTEKLQ